MVISASRFDEITERRLRDGAVESFADLGCQRMPQTDVHRDVNGLLRTFRQFDCRFEPGFEADDNATFYTCAPDYVSHGDHAECRWRGELLRLPHLISDCGWFRSL